MASVKVAVRVRPFNERELAMDAKCIIRMNLNKTIINNPSYNSKSTEIVSFSFKINYANLFLRQDHMIYLRSKSLFNEL